MIKIAHLGLACLLLAVAPVPGAAEPYLPDDDDAVLESDIDFTGGVTEENIKAWITLFHSLAREYAQVVE